MRATRRTPACLAALIMTLGLVAGCSPPIRGNLAITVDASGRIVVLVALCDQDNVEVLNLDVGNPGDHTGSRLLSFRPAPGKTPTELVLSSIDPGSDWLTEGPTLFPGPSPAVSADVVDPRASMEDETYSLNGLTTPRGRWDDGGNLPYLSYKPQNVMQDPRLRDGQVLDADDDVMSRADFEASPRC